MQQWVRAWGWGGRAQQGAFPDLATCVVLAARHGEAGALSVSPPEQAAPPHSVGWLAVGRMGGIEYPPGSLEAKTVVLTI